MKNILKYILILSVGLATLVSCNDFLDKLPDDRAELNSLDKVASFLVSAYPAHSPSYVLEYSSDNVMSNGNAYMCETDQDQLYRWQEVDVISGNDIPKSLWSVHYTAVATANEALLALESLPEGSLNSALRAEALMCRAYGMFQLANVFCMAWNPDKADEYLGLPYPKQAGVSVDVRGTLRELYANIDADIEAALPMVSDDHLKIPAYHFNVRAAYAFAARFNLFYNNYDKAISYATRVLGSDPSAVLRDVEEYLTLTANPEDVANAYIRSKANLMLATPYSLWGASFCGRLSSHARYAHNDEIIRGETYWVDSPYVDYMHEVSIMYGTNQCVYHPKIWYQAEVIDKVTGNGYPHYTDLLFTTDETLLVRAEAYARKGDKVQDAIDDVNTYLDAHCADTYQGTPRQALTEESINAWINGLVEVPPVVTAKLQRGIKKPFHPQGFTVAEGTQTNLLHVILHLRRLETMYLGQRFIDIKRYGIEFSHNLDGEEPIAFKAGDLRGAIQLPRDVVEAGLQANPR